MKKFTSSVVFLLVVLAASIAVADPDINIGNTNNIAATGGNANSNQNQDQKQNQNQDQKQKQDAHSSAIVTSPREYITAVPGMLGNIAPLAPIVADGKWHALLCDHYTIENLKTMIDSSSYVHREGFILFNIFKSPINWTRRIPQYEGEVKDTAEVRLVADDPDNVIVDEISGSGAYGAPLSAIVAYAGLQGVKDTNEYALVVYYRARDIAELSGLGVGSGAAGAVSSSDSARSGSLAVGAIIGYSEAYTKYVFDIQMKVVRPSAQALASAQNICYPPAVVVPSPIPAPPVSCPKPEVCNPDQFLKWIEIWKEACLHCKKPCFNNEKLRKCMGDTYADLYKCTGEKWYLEMAIKEYDLALKDFRNGHEPDGTKTKNMKGAKQIADWTIYNESWAIRELKGCEVQYKFAHEHKDVFKKDGKLVVPTTYEDLKR